MGHSPDSTTMCMMMEGRVD